MTSVMHNAIHFSLKTGLGQVFAENDDVVVDVSPH